MSNVPVNEVYHVFVEAKTQKQLTLTITMASENKSLRIKWADSMRVSIGLYPKGETKTQVALQHEKRVDAKVASALKA